MKAIISKGNSKLGKVPNISLPPVKACAKSVPCAKGCYALKSYRAYPNVKKAWDNNLEFCSRYRGGFFGDIDSWIARNKPRFFRWHVAGDILDQDYLERMKIVAKHNPATKFLAFTKRYDLKYHRLPDNLQIIMSVWPGYPLPKNRLPRAYMQDGSETRVKNAIECTGSCETCGMCFEIGKVDKNVVFHKH